MKKNTIYLGDNLEILKTFPDNSIDSVITDPPYGLGKEPDANEVLKAWVTDGYYEVSGKGFMGKEWDAFVPQPNFWKEIYRVLKPGGYLLSFAGTRTYDWVVMGVRLAGFEIRDMIGWLYGSGFPKGQDVSKAIDNHFGLEREIVGQQSYDMPSIKDTNKKIKEATGEKTGISFGHAIGAERITADITAPNHELAKEFDGWNTNLKPAIEPVVMARKPLIGTVVENVLKHRTGAINIDGCRVGDEEFVQYPQEIKSKGIYDDKKFDYKEYVGRFPTNVIHDGSDVVEAIFPTDNEGSAARFFYVPKASQSERNYGLEHFTKETTTDGRLKSIDNPYNRGETLRNNIHPTVKPIDLMRYLVRLVTPRGGVVLDPFVGSGTTAIAAKLEKMDYIGIELMPEYAKIAEARIKAHNIIEYSIFDFMDND